MKKKTQLLRKKQSNMIKTKNTTCLNCCSYQELFSFQTQQCVLAVDKMEMRFLKRIPAVLCCHTTISISVSCCRWEYIFSITSEAKCETYWENSAGTPELYRSSKIQSEMLEGKVYREYYKLLNFWSLRKSTAITRKFHELKNKHLMECPLFLFFFCWYHGSWWNIL